MARTYSYTFEAVDRVSSPVRNMAGALASANSRLQTFAGGVKDKTNKLRGFGDRIMSLRNIIVGSLAVGVARDLGGAVVSTMGNFERMEAVIGNTLGSDSMAKRVMSDLSGFAERTPFQVDQLTDAWVRLANQGFKPNMDEMTKLGDLASSTGKDIGMLSEAVIDAQVGEFERLKEFGIRAEKNGDKVKFTFKGISKEVDFTAGSIQDYLLSLGETQGVQGAMAKIMGTTAGMTSNFADMVTRLKLTIGEELKTEIQGIIQTGQRMVGWLVDGVKWIGANRESIGAWLKLLGVLAGSLGGIVLVAGTFTKVKMMIDKVKASFILLNTTLRISKIAMAAFNLVASLNPIGLIVLAIGAAITALIAFSGKFDEVRAWLGRIGQWLWEHHPFRWMIDLIDRVFPGFKSKLGDLLQGVIKAFNQAWKWLYNNFFKPVLGALDAVFGKFFNFKGIPAPTAKTDMEVEPGQDPYGRPTGGAAPTAPGPGGKPTGGNVGVSKAVAGVAGGERNVKNITINIQKLNDGGININTTTLGMGTGQVEAEMKRILLSVVNDVNYQ